MQYQLKSRQICFFLIAFLPINKLFIMPSVLAGVANEDMWISAVISLLLDFVTLLFVLRTARNAKTDFFGLLENSFGKTGAKIILILYFIYFTLKAIIPLNEQKDYVDLTLYTLKPSIFYFLPFFLVPLYLCSKKIRVLGRASDVLWMITVNGFITLIALSIGNADFAAILPIGARGATSVIKGSYLTVGWYGDSVYILFLIGEFLCRKKDGIKICLSYLCGAIMVIVFMITFYAIFTSIAYRQRFALTEISKYTTVINNLGRFDYIGIILILFSGLIALSLPMYFGTQIINYILNFKKVWIAPIITVGIQILIMLIFYQYIYSIENFIMNYAGVLFILLGNVFPCFAVLMNKKELKYEKS